VDITHETTGDNRVATLTLQPTSTWRGHRAGQHVQVGVEINGARRTTRCFSISSAESGPGEAFTITVRAHEEARPGQQRVSRFLVHEAKPGQVLHLSQAEGDFTLTESPATPTNNHLLMISGGSGITPVMSQVRTLLRDGYDGRANRKVTFLHYARSEEDLIFAEELRRIQFEDNHVDVQLRFGDDVFSEESLARLVPDFRNTDTWACGPAPMMELIHAAYDGSPRLRSEYFKLATATAGATGSADGDLSFTRAGTSTANTGTSILEQAEAAGLAPEYGCRMGICFTCVSRKSEGTVRNVVTGEESSLPDEDIRICVSAPVGDCAVDL
jgi:ferredoxin-NADP reductase